jgi:SPP1 gp7 family putative phage head morphogenesis protein
MPPKPTKQNEIVGGILRPNAAIQQEYTQSILTLIRKMGDEVKRTVVAVFEEHVVDAAMDGRASPQARIQLNALREKYEILFARLAKRATKRMVARTLKNATVTTGMSLRDMAPQLVLNPDAMTGRMQDIISASSTEAANLIKLIPTKYLGDVQNQVMRSITTGQGLKDLVPFLNDKYNQNIRHARNVAMDQTRKVYTALSAERMQQAGVTKFKWLHTGGSQHPRELHLKLDGKVFGYDDPPVIDERTGEKGLPGQAIFCRCTMRPVLSF